MPLSDKHVGPKIFAKIKIYNLTRAELLFNLCYEIPCTLFYLKSEFKSKYDKISKGYPIRKDCVQKVPCFGVKQ